MRRLGRKTVAVVAGLLLGWYAAGMIPLGRSAALAEQPAHQQAAEAGERPVAGESHGADAHAAHELAPQGKDAAFMGPVLLGGAILFGAAIVLGIPALKLRGPLPPDPADTHDAHDSDSHGH